MTLYELLTNIQNIGEINHIGSSFIGDIYELNHRQDIEYPAFVITQGTHQIDNENETDIYNLSLFLVDRLTEDKSNEKDIHSWSVAGINSIIKGIESSGISYQIRNQNIDTFTEKFNSLCAGAFANLYITIEQNCCCNEPNLVTSVNGLTGDIFIKGIDGKYVKSVNGMDGNVILDIPSKTSELENDADFITTDESITYTDEKVNELSERENEHYEEIQGELVDVNKDIEGINTHILQVETDKQDVLVSGQNIKTVNGESLIGEGNMVVKYDDTKIKQDIADVKVIAESKTTMSEVEAKGYLTEETEPKYTTDKPNIALKSEIPSLDGYATEQWVEEKGYLTEETEPIYTTDKPNIALKSEIPSLDGYATEQWVEAKGYLTEEIEPIYTTDKPTIATKAELAVLEQKIDEIELSKVPNVTIFGNPTIQNGQVSNFSTSNYLQFPFLVDLTNKSFTINMCFTTSDNLTAQQNIFDSEFGFAFAIKNGRFIAAISSNGTSWDSGELIGSSVVKANTTYYYKIVGNYNNDNTTTYQFQVSEDNVEFIDDMVGVTMASPYPRHIIIGKSIDNTHIFNGSINLNNCKVIVNNQEIWQGMDSVGLATRLATDMSNIDSSGVAYINQMIDDKIGLISETLNIILGDE